jgi:RNA polymerase sigma-70 factor, ECF subfamily
MEVLESTPAKTAGSPDVWQTRRDLLGSPPPRRPVTTVDLTSIDDRDLVTLALKGRETAYRELLSRYERPVFSLVFRMVRDRSLAEDLAQETFIRAFHALKSFNPSYRFSSWLFKIANNLTIDHLRKRTLETVSLDGAPGAVSQEEVDRTRIAVADGGEDPLSYVENRELGGQIEEAIGRLRPEYRTAVLLRHVEGYSYEEIAGIMEVPLGTVKTFLHRARHELKGYLEDA